MKPSKTIQVNITYNCNRDCSYCYAKSLKEDYGKDMDIEDFRALLEWFEKNNINKLNLIGGEPTIHPLIGDMVTLAKKKNFKISLTTNGLFPHNFLKYISGIHEFLVNYNLKEEYTDEEYRLLHKNLRLIKQKKKSLILAFNLTDETTSCNHVIKAVKQYNVEKVHMDFITPNSLKSNKHVPFSSFKKYKEKMKLFFKKFKENDIRVRVARPIPRCIFEDIIKENKGQASSLCSVGIRILSVNPDLTIFPCLSIFFKGPKIISFKTFEEAISFYHGAIADIRWKRHLYPSCKSCIYFIRKKCQGSCLCYKLTPFNIIKKEDYELFSQYDSKEIKGFTRDVDEAIKSLNNIFGRPKKRIKIYLFNKRKDLLYYSGIYFYPDWVGGFSDSNAYYQYSTKIGNRIIHELCHVYLARYKEGKIPLWLEEGFCEYVTYQGREDLRLKTLTKEKNLIPFNNLFEKDKLSLLKYDSSHVEKNIAYAQSHSLVKHLVDKFGLSVIMELLKGNYKDFKQHFKKLTKQTFFDTEKKWLCSTNL